MNIVLIAATTLDGKISKHSNEYVDWSLDLKLFKKQTINNTIIMGSTTFKTLKNKLVNRELIVFNRLMNPQLILNNIKSKKCFIIGGTKTFSIFSDFYTHLYITPHPLFFGEKGNSLFESINFNREIIPQKKVLANKEKKIYQLQYKVCA